MVRLVFLFFNTSINVNYLIFAINLLHKHQTPAKLIQIQQEFYIYPIQHMNLCQSPDKVLIKAAIRVIINNLRHSIKNLRFFDKSFHLFYQHHYHLNYLQALIRKRLYTHQISQSILYE